MSVQTALGPGRAQRGQTKLQSSSFLVVWVHCVPTSLFSLFAFYFLVCLAFGRRLDLVWSVYILNQKKNASYQKKSLKSSSLYLWPDTLMSPAPCHPVGSEGQQSSLGASNVAGHGLVGDQAGHPFSFPSQTNLIHSKLKATVRTVKSPESRGFCEIPPPDRETCCRPAATACRTIGTPPW